MTQPVRIQRKRTRGWNMQADSPNGLPVVYVGRPTVFGNPFRHWTDEFGERSAAHDVRLFEYWLTGRIGHEYFRRAFGPRTPDRLVTHKIRVLIHKRNCLGVYLPALRGKNLACWCAPDASCHADVLLKLANQ